jgi:hypothetical protein
LTAKGIAGGRAGLNVEAAVVRQDRIERHNTKGNEVIMSGKSWAEPESLSHNNIYKIIRGNHLRVVILDEESRSGVQRINETGMIEQHCHYL